MATYCGRFRSNYFKVKNADEYEMFCDLYGLTLIKKKDDGDMYGFMSEDSPTLPSGYYSEAAGDFVETDFFQELSKHMLAGEVAVVMETGYESMRYLIGGATAVNSNGKVLCVSLEDIYEKIKKCFKTTTTRCEY